MAKATEKNYSAAQEIRMAAAAVENGGRIDNAKALELAEEFGKDVRSIRAKAVRMDLYKAAEKKSKSGGKIEGKDDIVAEIAAIVGANMEGLEKAPKLALQNIRKALTATG